MNAKTIINAKNKLISETEQKKCDTMLRSILVKMNKQHLVNVFTLYNPHL